MAPRGRRVSPRSMWKLGPVWDDEASLAAAWRAARPFSHLVFDELLGDDDLAAVLAVIEEEVVDSYAADIYAFDATAPEPTTDAFRALRDGLAGEMAPRLSRITGQAVGRVDMRAYAYRAGHFLLPHSDHQLGVGRVLAYAFYLPTPEPPEGGELELFECEIEGGEVVSTRSVQKIAPRANRLVVFEVSDRSLHQVCEVLSGLRPSLSGWFYE